MIRIESCSVTIRRHSELEPHIDKESCDEEEEYHLIYEDEEEFPYLD